MKIRVSEATPAQLDYLAASTMGTGTYWQSKEFMASFSPTTDWEQGGPIIEREIAKIFRNVGGTWTAMILKDVPIPPEDRGTSLALTRRVQWNAAGPTPLIAAMRCYVASKLGDEVEVPEGLL